MILTLITKGGQQMDVSEKMHTISISSDSRLKSFQYHSGKISLDFVSSNNEYYKVSVETECLQTTLKEILDGINYVFSISVVELSDFLLVENGVYMPPHEFVQFMRNVKEGFFWRMDCVNQNIQCYFLLKGISHCIAS
jgi:hypothetical protein